MPRLISANDLVLSRRPLQPVILPGELDGRLGHLRTAALELDRAEVAGGQLGQQIRQLHRHRIRPVHRRRERETVVLLFDRLDHTPVVMSD